MSRLPSSNQLGDYKASNKSGVLTSSNGNPLDSKTASLSVGPKGPLLLQDFTFIDELAHFDRERIPERVVHAKGAGAFGYFEVTHDVTAYTKLSVFSKIGKRTPVAVRFSTVGGESGSADTARDPRGFAVKFYAEDGNWDVVGNNTPVFFIRDPILFPSFIHTQKRNPQTHLKDPDMFWDFISLRPETTHQVMILFSDRGTPDGYRNMNGYGSHTFKLLNDRGESVYCKFHYKTDQGIKNLSTEKAAELGGTDPDYSIRDLYNAIAKKQYPTWTWYIQVMTHEQAEKCKWNPFDVTKVWPHADHPLIPVGKMVLDKNPKNYFAEVEQIAFSPAHMIPGVEPSPDKMLQGRLFSYTDTHRHRLGPNYLQIPVNCPYRATVANTLRDGPMTVTDNQGGAPNYFPNSFSGPIPQIDAALASYNVKGDVQRLWYISIFTSWGWALVSSLTGISFKSVIKLVYKQLIFLLHTANPYSNVSPDWPNLIYRFETGGEDNFSQPRMFWTKTLDGDARKRLVANIVDHLKDAADFIQERTVKNFAQVHPDFGDMLSDGLRKHARSTRPHL